MSDLGWFSDMSWQHVLLLLVPVAVIVWLVKRIERHQKMAQFYQASPAVKAWLWLHCLQPAASAKAMLQCDPLLLRAYMEAGQELGADAAAWLQAAAREFLKADGVNVKFGSDDDLLAVLSEYVEENTAEALAAAQSLWPVQPAASAADSLTPQAQAETTAELDSELRRCESRQPDAAPSLEPLAGELQPLPIWDDGPSNEAEGK